ncbi:MAG: gamma-glutamylcyclotransferase, partial [Planctomycetota bacterium]
MLYFAYGSNMSTPRLRRRVSRAVPVATARLPGCRLAFHKLGADGSGKCDACPAGRAEEVVWG